MTKSVSFKKEPTPVEKVKASKAAGDDDDSDDSMDWGSDSESESGSSEEDTQYTSIRERFLKK